MNKIVLLLKKYKWVTIFLVLIIGTIARVSVALRGHNYDIESYLLVGEIVSRGGNVYAETFRYNYGPIWFYIVGLFYEFSQLFKNSFEVFRMMFPVFLTCVDIGLFSLLFKKYGAKAAVIFFLNPISIIISGYHGQFDNLSILFAMSAAVLYGDDFSYKVTKNKFLALILLAISITTKHIFLVFPLWIAVKQKGWWQKIVVIGLPITIFVLSFLPFWEVGGQGIIQNVIEYKSFNNAPFWNYLLPSFIKEFISAKQLFLVALVAGAFVFRRKAMVDSLLLYSGLIVLFAMAIANQYLAIVIPFIAVNFNWVYLVYTIFTSLYLTAALEGLHLYRLKAYLPKQLNADEYPVYFTLILIFFAGFVWMFFKVKVISLVKQLIEFAKTEILYQWFSVFAEKPIGPRSTISN